MKHTSYLPAYEDGADRIIHTYLFMKMEQIECSKTSAYKIQTPGNYPEESIRYPHVVFTVPFDLLL